MSPARVSFFVLLVWPRVYFLAILVWARQEYAISWAILFKEMSDFCDSCRETQSPGDFGLESAHLAIFVWKTLGTFDVELSLAKHNFHKNWCSQRYHFETGLWAAHPYPKLAENPPCGNTIKGRPNLETSWSYVSCFWCFEIGDCFLLCKTALKYSMICFVQDTISESLLDFPRKSQTPVEALWSLRSIDLRVIALHPSLANSHMPQNASLVSLISEPIRVNVFFLCHSQKGEFAVSRAMLMN